jgi:flagellar biosynthesis GTPase FlhF
LEVRNRQANRANTWTRSRITKEYIGGTITRLEAAGLLAKTIPDLNDVQRVLDECDQLREADRKRKCIAAYKSRYMRGEFTLKQTKDQLALLGVPAEAIDPIGDGWLCELTSKNKAPAVGTIRKWLRRGFITLADARNRLLNMHYRPEDADRILADMVAAENERLGQLAKAAVKERMRKAAESEKEWKKAEKEFERELKAAESAAKKMMDEAKANNKELQRLKAKAEADKKAAEKAKTSAETKAAKAAEKAAKEAAKIAEKAAKAASLAADTIEPAADPQMSFTEEETESDMETSPDDTESDSDQPEEETGTEGQIEENSDE